MSIGQLARATGLSAYHYELFAAVVETFLASAELGSPSSGAWTAVGSVATGRAGHTATLLQFGKVSLPPSVTLAPGASQTFTGSGGTGIGYMLTLVANGSDGTVGAMTGVYTPGAAGGAADVVGVTDSFGNAERAPVTVTKASSCSATGGSAFPLLAVTVLVPLCRPPAALGYRVGVSYLYSLTIATALIYRL